MAEASASSDVGGEWRVAVVFECLGDDALCAGHRWGGHVLTLDHVVQTVKRFLHGTSQLWCRPSDRWGMNNYLLRLKIEHTMLDTAYALTEADYDQATDPVELTLLEERLSALTRRMRDLSARYQIVEARAARS